MIEVIKSSSLEDSVRASLNFQDYWDSYTALMYEARNGDVEGVTMLIEAGANPDIEDRKKKRARDCAIKRGYYHIVKLLDSYDSYLFRG